jgi:hypothetical protein
MTYYVSLNVIVLYVLYMYHVYVSIFNSILCQVGY